MLIKTTHILVALIIVLAYADGKAMKRTKRRVFDADYSWNQLVSAFKEDIDTPVPDNLNCDWAMDELLLRLPEFGSIFYVLVNGWYLG